MRLISTRSAPRRGNGPSCSAVALAAVLSEEFKQLERIERVGVMLSGGNVDLDHLPW